MSELLDLPPELIEQIFTEVEAQVDQDPQDTEETKIKAPLFCLTNRYIEKCTRRTFAATYVATLNIHISNDASIRRFCDMAQSSDLAESVVTLKLYVNNDRDPRQWGNSIDRDDFVDALYDCLSIAELQFHNAPTDQAAEVQQAELARDTVEAPASPSVFDINSSFDYVLSLAEDADVRPLWLSTDGRPLCGLADFWTFLKRSGAVCEVENLSLHVIPEEPRSGITPRDAGLIIGGQLGLGLNSMPSLKSLHLSFDLGSTGGIPVWSMLAKAPRLPNLERLQLHCCGMNVHDYTTFVLCHMETLKLVDVSWLGLHDATIVDISRFYAELARAPKLETFYQYGLSWGDYERCNWIRMPRHLCVPQDRKGENEDGYTEIELWCWSIRMDDQAEVRSVLAELAVCL